jgi:sigma-70-like protein
VLLLRLRFFDLEIESSVDVIIGKLFASMSLAFAANTPDADRCQPTNMKSNRQQLALLILDEVGRLLGLSRQRVQIIESEALRKLRARLLDVLQQEFGDLTNNHTRRHLPAPAWRGVTKLEERRELGILCSQRQRWVSIADLTD